MPVVSVLLVDDHPIFSKGLAQLIGAQCSYKVIGEARDNAEAMDLLRRESPDLAVVDLNLGDEDGLETIKNMKAVSPELVVLVLSMHDERYYAERAIRAGARGYIMKQEAGSNVLDAIKTVMSGKIWLSESERERMFNSMVGAEPLRENDDRYTPVNSLSDRQLQIFAFIGKGLGTIEIAAKLNLSTKTIDTHKEHIKLKLHCSNAQELRQFAIEWTTRRKE